MKLWFVNLRSTSNYTIYYSLFSLLQKIDLLKQNEPFTTAIYNSLDSTFSLSIVTDENELYEALFKLYGAKIEGYDRAYEKYVEHFSSNTDGIIIIENGKVSRKGNM